MKNAPKTEEQEFAEVTQAIKSMPEVKGGKLYQFMKTVELPLQKGAITVIADKFGEARQMVTDALSARLIFEKDAEFKAQWEHLLEMGIVAPRRVLNHHKAKRDEAARKARKS